MSVPSLPDPAKLIIGVFLRDKEILSQITEELVKMFGPMDVIGPWMEFNFTTYYEKEMGAPLFRRLFSFRNLIQQDALPDIKIQTNELEKRFSRNRTRMVNIDPGYLLRERFVLATGKNFTHRIYIGKGIYADLTLIFYKGSFRTLQWTYPDYASREMISLLTLLRKRYIIDLKEKKKKE